MSGKKGMSWKNKHGRYNNKLNTVVSDNIHIKIEKECQKRCQKENADDPDQQSESASDLDRIFSQGVQEMVPAHCLRIPAM